MKIYICIVVHFLNVAFTILIIEFRRQRRKIEESLNGLMEQKKRIDERYASLVNEENKVYDEIHKCWDIFQNDRLQMRLNFISNQRRTIEQEKMRSQRRLGDTERNSRG